MKAAHILVCNRPSSYEVTVTYEDGTARTVCSTYRVELGRYSPSVEEAIELLRAALASNPEVPISHLSQ